MTQPNTEQTLRGAEVVETLQHCRNLLDYAPDYKAAEARDQILVKLIDLFSGMNSITWGQAGSSTRE